MRKSEQRYPAAAEKLLFNQTLKRVLDRLVSDLIVNSQKLIGEAGVKSVKAVRRYPQRLIAFSPQVDAERKQIKEFFYAERLLQSGAAAGQAAGRAGDNRDVCVLYEDSAGAAGQLQEKTRTEPLHKIVCDYVAGMTDSYIFEQHQRFCGDKKEDRRIEQQKQNLQVETRRKRGKGREVQDRLEVGGRLLRLSW